MPSPDPTTETRKRGRPKMHSDAEQSGAIAETARQLFLEHGYGGSTMSMLAARCRMSKRTLYRLFPGKKDVLAAVVALHRHSMLGLPLADESLPLAQALERILQVDIDPDLDKERQTLLRMMLVEGAQNPEIVEVMRTFGADKARGMLAEWLQQQKDLGRADVGDPVVAATMLMDMTFGARLLKSNDGPSWPGGEARSAYLRQCIHIFVNGVRPR